MDLAESAQYLRHHLALVSRTDPLFADDAIAGLHKASLGLPRALNKAAVAALIAAATAGGAAEGLVYGGQPTAAVVHLSTPSNGT